MVLVLSFEHVIQSRSTATLLHSISKIHKQSLINLYQLIFSSFLKSFEWTAKIYNDNKNCYLRAVIILKDL